MNFLISPQSLLYFEVVGVFLAGVGAGAKVIKELFKKRNERLRRVPTADPDYPDNEVAQGNIEVSHSVFWETLELALIAGGIMMNLTATAIDQNLSKVKNEAAAAQTLNQIALLSNSVQNATLQLGIAQQSLTELERLVTRFDTINIESVDIALPEDDPNVSDLWAQLSPMLRDENSVIWYFDRTVAHMRTLTDHEEILSIELNLTKFSEWAQGNWPEYKKFSLLFSVLQRMKFDLNCNRTNFTFDATNEPSTYPGLSATAIPEKGKVFILLLG